MNTERQRQLILECECGSSHFVTLTGWDGDPEDGEQFRYLSLVEESRADGWWDRIKGAWFVLAGRNHDWCEILLSKETAAELAIALAPPSVQAEGIITTDLYLNGRRIPPSGSFKPKASVT